MVGEFPGIVELFPGGKPGAFREQLFKNTQVAVRIAGFQFSVGYGSLTVQHDACRSNGFMYGALEPQAGQTADQTLPVIGKGWIPSLVKGGVITQHHHIGVRCKGGFQG